MECVKTVGKDMVPRAGVEPARPFGQRILSPQRLPFRHPGTVWREDITPFSSPGSGVTCATRSDFFSLQPGPSSEPF